MPLRIRGYALAGGESSRMQRDGLPRDKASLQLGGTTLLQRTLRTLADVCDETAILCGVPDRCARLGAYGRTVMDRLPVCGPLGALDAALIDAAFLDAHAPVTHVLLLPVDLPFLSPALLQRLIATAEEDADVACFRTAESMQPLPVLVDVQVREAIAAALDAGERKLMPTLRAVAGSRLTVIELSADEERSSFFNLNTPEDWQAARERVLVEEPAESR